MAPESQRAFFTRALIFAALMFIVATPAHALRVLSWNILNYPGNSAAARDPYYRIVIAQIQPDIIVTGETSSQLGVDTFLNDVLNVVEPGQWAALPFVDGNDTDCGLFYKTSKFSTPTQLAFYPNSANLLRYVHEYIVHPIGYTSQADNDGQLYDPLGLQGIAWQDNASMAIYHTQSPCKVQGDPNCASGAAFGGMDDRFDLILPTMAWNDGLGYELVPGSYVTVGNDGQHLNLQLIDPPTIPEGAAFAAALQRVSDHLPLRVDIQVPAIAAVASALDLGTAIVGTSGTLDISNVAIAPADGLTYTLTPPAGFSAPGGTFNLASGGTDHRVIATTAGLFGPRAGDLVLASDDLDHPSRAIALTANILDHAHASLDSTIEMTSASVDFGNIPSGAFTPATIRVHDFGYSSAQAKLALSGARVAGANGRFSVVSGDTNATLANVGQSFEIAFDATGATPDSQYTATLTITGNDEPLPGAAPSTPLTVYLSATVYSGPLAVPAGPGTPGLTQLYTPFPNPLTSASRIHFDLARHTELRLDVIDLSGRRIATLEDRAFEPGRYSLAWSGQDDSGSRVSAGVYFIRMTGSSLKSQAVRLAVVR